MKILLVEDDTSLNEALKMYFTKAGYAVLQAYDAKEAEEKLKYEPDIMIADVGLPGESGVNFCKRVLRHRRLPVIFLTAKDEEADILSGYAAGCQEYVTKPVSPKVLEKKIEVILRRGKEENVLEYKDLRVDCGRGRVWNSSGEIRLTAKEWEVLYILVLNRGKIITREMLLEKVWDADGNFVGDHTLSVVINRLRKKLEQDPTRPVYIKNVFGIGYTFGE